MSTQPTTQTELDRQIQEGYRRQQMEELARGLRPWLVGAAIFAGLYLLNRQGKRRKRGRR